MANDNELPANGHEHQPSTPKQRSIAYAREMIEHQKWLNDDKAAGERIRALKPDELIKVAETGKLNGLRLTTNEREWLYVAWERCFEFPLDLRDVPDGKEPEPDLTAPGTEREYLSYREVAAWVGCSVGTIRNYVMSGELAKPHKIGKRMVRFMRSEVQVWAERNRK